MQSFGPIAPHYDLLMQSVPYDMWAGYYRLLLAQIDHDPDSLLDVCCGTGTLAEHLTKVGYQVTGVDLSAPMIAVAQEKASASGLDIVYHVDDVRDFDLEESFDGAYSFFDSLNYITDLQGFWNALKSVADHLVEGGSFVFDLNTPYAFEAGMFDQQDKRKRAQIQYEWHGDYDPDTRQIRVEMDFTKDGQTFKEVHCQRAHSDDEVREGLQKAGFEWVRAFDSYTLDPPGKKSDRVHYVAVMP